MGERSNSILKAEQLFKLLIRTFFLKQIMETKNNFKLI